VRTPRTSRFYNPGVLRRLATLAAAPALVLALVAHAASAAEEVRRTLRVDGVERSYILFLPDDPDARGAWPVIVGFHPAIAQGRYMRERARLQAAPGAENYVLAFPDGRFRTWNAGDCCGRAYRSGVDDMAFLRAIIADIGSIVGTEDEVYLTGFSNGARMVYHIMCVAPDMVAAAVTIGATRNMDDCAPSRIPLMHIHGAEDEGSPVEGGQLDGLIGKRIGYMEPARSVAAVVAQRNGCGGSTRAEAKQDTLGTTCEAWTGCPGSAEVVLCIVPDMGHTWPGEPESLRMFAPYRPDLDASRAVIRFFDRH